MYSRYQVHHKDRSFQKYGSHWGSNHFLCFYNYFSSQLENWKLLWIDLNNVELTSCLSLTFVGSQFSLSKCLFDISSLLLSFQRILIYFWNWISLSNFGNKQHRHKQSEVECEDDIIQLFTIWLNKSKIKFPIRMEKNNFLMTWKS